MESNNLKQNTFFDGYNCLYKDDIIKFFNDPQVRTSTHVNSSVLTWNVCNMDVYNNYKFNVNQFSVFESLFRTSDFSNVMIISGDNDAIVPTTSTLYWIDILREMYAISDIDPWREFHSGSLLSR